MANVYGEKTSVVCDLVFCFGASRHILGLNPFRAPKPLPIPLPSNLSPKMDSSCKGVNPLPGSCCVKASYGLKMLVLMSRVLFSVSRPLLT